MLRLGFLGVLVVAALPAGVSAQADGTMQVTARVLPGRPAWAGLAEGQALVRQFLAGPEDRRVRRSGLVQARADLASGAGRRRLLITIDYPRN